MVSLADGENDGSSTVSLMAEFISEEERNGLIHQDFIGNLSAASHSRILQPPGKEINLCPFAFTKYAGASYYIQYREFPSRFSLLSMRYVPLTLFRT